MIAKQDFFAEEDAQTEQSESQEPEKVKIGEKEYSQEDLAKLVGYGEKAVELEDKWNTKIDKLYPEYTKSRQELATIKQQQQEAVLKAQEEINKKAGEGQQLSPEEQDKLIEQELEKRGVVTQKNVYQYVANFIQAQELNREIDTIRTDAEGDGKPKVTREDLLDYMDESGVKNPRDAYELMFKKELKDWESKQVQSLKKPSFVTETSSVAGSKEPLPQKITKENISDILNQALEE